MSLPGTSRNVTNSLRFDVFFSTCNKFQLVWSPAQSHSLNMFTQQLFEIFWEHVKLLMDLSSSVLQFCPDMIQSQVALYADDLVEERYPLESWVWFIDCTRTRVKRPGGHVSIQPACYSGHKRMYCLVYQTINVPDDFLRCAIFRVKAPQLCFATSQCLGVCQEAVHKYLGQTVQ